MRALAASDVECRIGQVSEQGKGVTLLLYKDARVDMRMLDEEFGPEGWQCRYSEHKGTLFCAIGVLVDGRWVWKEDAGTPSNMEAQKGEASDAFKRAGFRWGIGRELYTAPRIFVPADRCRVFQDKGRWKCFDKFEVTSMHVEDGHIDQLTVVNAKTGQVVYQFGREHDKLDGIRSRIKAYAQRRQITVADAKAEIERWAKVSDMAEIAEDYVPDVEAMMDEVIAA